MESPRPQLIILADAPDALCILFGISLLERLLRIVQRLGFRDAVILSDSKEVTDHLAAPSWARADVALSFQRKNAGTVNVVEIPTGTDGILIVSAGFYYDARLLKALAEQSTTTLLVDSAPSPDCARLRRTSLPAAALVGRNWLSRQDQSAELMNQLISDAAAGKIETCDAAQQPTYIMPLRKHVRPVFFPAPSSNQLPVAQRFVRDIAQNGVLDFPGLMDSPIEDWIVARLCRTSITPNQITFVTMLIGLIVTAFFATGHRRWGVVLDYVMDMLDGVVGKVARSTCRTTNVGQ